MNMMDRKMRPTRMAADVLPLVWSVAVMEAVDISVSPLSEEFMSTDLGRIYRSHKTRIFRQSVHKRRTKPSARMRHVLRAHQPVVVIGCYEAGLQRFLAQRGAVFMRGLGDLGGVVVADGGRQRGDQHQRAIER